MRLAVGVEHLPHADVRVVDRQVGALLERHAVHLVRGEEHAVLSTSFELEVRADLRCVERRTSPCGPSPRRTPSPTALSLKPPFLLSITCLHLGGLALRASRAAGTDAGRAASSARSRASSPSDRRGRSRGVREPEQLRPFCARSCASRATIACVSFGRRRGRRAPPTLRRSSARSARFVREASAGCCVVF